MLVYGIHAVSEALQRLPQASAGTLWLSASRRERSVQALLERAKALELRVREVRREKLDQLAPGAVHQGVVLEAEAFCYSELDTVLERAKGRNASIIMILDGIQDPQNLGALLRTASAFGLLGVIIPKDRAASVNATAIKASAGAALHLPVVRVPNLARAIEQVQEAGYWVYGATGDAKLRAEDCDWNGHIALVMGAEGQGLRRLTRERCDHLLRLDHEKRMESLNVSVAAGILLYLVSRAQVG